MAKPGSVLLSVVLAVLMVQFFPQMPRSVSAARFVPAVVSHEGGSATGSSLGASFVPKDIGLKVERRLSDDREETNGAPYKASVNEVSQGFLHWAILCSGYKLVQTIHC